MTVDNRLYSIVTKKNNIALFTSKADEDKIRSDDIFQSVKTHWRASYDRYHDKKYIDSEKPHFALQLHHAKVLAKYIHHILDEYGLSIGLSKEEQSTPRTLEEKFNAIEKHVFENHLLYCQRLMLLLLCAGILISIIGMVGMTMTHGLFAPHLLTAASNYLDISVKTLFNITSIITIVGGVSLIGSNVYRQLGNKSTSLLTLFDDGNNTQQTDEEFPEKPALLL